MSEPKMTAQERLAPETALSHTLDFGQPVVEASVAAALMDEHAAAAVAEVTRERDEARQRCREAAQTLIAEIGAPGPEDVTTTAKRAVERIEKAEARVAELEAALRNARHAIADSHANINESRTQRALRCLQLVAREIESVLAPQAPPARKEDA